MKLRTFFSQCTPQALEYLDEHVNDWLAEKKAKVIFTNQSFGIIEGKGGQKQPTVFVNVWYEETE